MARGSPSQPREIHELWIWASTLPVHHLLSLSPWPLLPPGSPSPWQAPPGGLGTAERFNSYYSIKINNIKMS